MEIKEMSWWGGRRKSGPHCGVACPNLQSSHRFYARLVHFSRLGALCILSEVLHLHRRWQFFVLQKLPVSNGWFLKNLHSAMKRFPHFIFTAFTSVLLFTHKGRSPSNLARVGGLVRNRSKTHCSCYRLFQIFCRFYFVYWNGRPVGSELRGSQTSECTLFRFTIVYVLQYFF